MVDSILEILKLLVFGVKCLNFDTTKLFFRNRDYFENIILEQQQ